SSAGSATYLLACFGSPQTPNVRADSVSPASCRRASRRYGLRTGRHGLNTLGDGIGAGLPSYSMLGSCLHHAELTETNTRSAGSLCDVAIEPLQDARDVFPVEFVLRLPPCNGKREVEELLERAARFPGCASRVLLPCFALDSHLVEAGD